MEHAKNSRSLNVISTRPRRNLKEANMKKFDAENGFLSEYDDFKCAHHVKKKIKTSQPLFNESIVHEITMETNSKHKEISGHKSVLHAPRSTGTVKGPREVFNAVKPVNSSLLLLANAAGRISFEDESVTYRSSSCSKSKLHAPPNTMKAKADRMIESGSNSTQHRSDNYPSTNIDDGDGSVTLSDKMGTTDNDDDDESSRHSADLQETKSLMSNDLHIKKTVINDNPNEISSCQIFKNRCRDQMEGDRESKASTDSVTATVRLENCKRYDSEMAASHHNAGSFLLVPPSFPSCQLSNIASMQSANQQISLSHLSMTGYASASRNNEKQIPCILHKCEATNCTSTITLQRRTDEMTHLRFGNQSALNVHPHSATGLAIPYVTTDNFSVYCQNSVPLVQDVNGQTLCSTGLYKPSRQETIQFENLKSNPNLIPQSIYTGSAIQYQGGGYAKCEPIDLRDLYQAQCFAVPIYSLTSNLGYQLHAITSPTVRYTSNRGMHPVLSPKPFVATHYPTVVSIVPELIGGTVAGVPVYANVHSEGGERVIPVGHPGWEYVHTKQLVPRR